MDAKNQKDRAKMVEEAVGRMCRLGMMPQVITRDAVKHPGRLQES